MTNQQKHDLLMELRPDDAQHDEAVCMFCITKASEEEKVAEKKEAIFTQEQHEQLLATAVEKASIEAKAGVDAEVLSLNEKLKAVTKAAEESAETITKLEKATADRDEAERLAVLEGERVVAVKAVAKFSDEQIEKRKESWSKMDDDDFEAYLEDIKAIAAVKPDDDPSKKPTFDITRTTAGADVDGTAVSAFFQSDLSVAAQS